MLTSNQISELIEFLMDYIRKNHAPKYSGFQVGGISEIKFVEGEVIVSYVYDDKYDHDYEEMTIPKSEIPMIQ